MKHGQQQALANALLGPGDPEPVHRRVIQEEGIPLIEFAYLEELARDRVYEFLFICIPLSIRGATGSLVRPLAIV